MIKRLVVSGAVVSAAALASPALAGEMYVNPELNTSVGTDSGVGAAILETHVGYEFDNGAYVQVGPAAIFPDDGEMEDIEISGKAGIGSGPLYGELSFITGDETTVGVKVGSKFTF
nr:unknown [uncultured Mediterranean phage uvMED]